jgi:hypothetical protein
MHYNGANREMQSTKVVRHIGSVFFLHRERDHKVTILKLFQQDPCDLV